MRRSIRVTEKDYQDPDQSLMPGYLPTNRWNPPSISTMPDWNRFRRVSIDTETNDPQLSTLGPGVRRGARIVGVSLAFEDGPAYYLPVGHSENNLDPTHVFSYLKDKASAYDGDIVGANLQYDIDFLNYAGVHFPKVNRFRDIQIAEPLIDELQFSYSMENIAKRRGLAGKNEIDLDEISKVYHLDAKKGMARFPARFVADYAIQDVRLPLQILKSQEAEIKRLGIENIYDMECRLLPILLRMRQWGVAIDGQRLDEVERWSIEKQLTALDKVYSLSGVRLGLKDVNNTDALLIALNNIPELNLPKNSRGFSIDKGALTAAKHPIADAVMEARKYWKIQTSFVASVRKHVINGRVHCTFNQMRKSSDDSGADDEGARYGRLSMSDFNAQQQPGRDDEYDSKKKAGTLVEGDLHLGKYWRSIYIPDEGMQWASVDYSGQEPRWIIHYAHITKKNGQPLQGAAEMVAAYNENPDLDLHQRTADLADIDRKPAKIIFLGCIGKGSPVKTNRGFIPIELVRLDDLLWDGVEWVSHSGVISKGIKQCQKIQSIWMTPDHEVLTTSGWCQAQYLNTLSQKLGLSTDISQSLKSSEGKEAELSPSNVFASVVQNLPLYETISSKVSLLDVVDVLKKQLLTIVPPTTRFMDFVHSHTVKDYLTECVRSLVDVIQNQEDITEKGQSSFTLSGSTIATCFLSTLCLYRDGIIQVLKSTGLIPLTDTVPEIFGSSLTEITCLTPVETFDIVNAGPRRRYQVDNMIVSNCAYGMGGAKLCRSLGLPTELKWSRRFSKMIEIAGPEGQAILDKYDAMVPFLKGLAKLCEKKARKSGVVKTTMGRLCHFPKDHATGDYQFTHKALNRIIQGSAADQTKLAIVKCDEAGVMPQLQIHDELDRSVNMDGREARQMADIMRTCMTISVPVKCDIELGTSWGDSMH